MDLLSFLCLNKEKTTLSVWAVKARTGLLLEMLNIIFLMNAASGGLINTEKEEKRR